MDNKKISNIIKYLVLLVAILDTITGYLDSLEIGSQAVLYIRLAGLILVTISNNLVNWVDDGVKGLFYKRES